jgi:gp16 family phage-associated protein
MTQETPMTSQTFKARLRAQGKTIGQWADENQFNRLDVYRVLNGVYKAHYGKAHEIAVRAGLKADPDQLAA